MLAEIRGRLAPHVYSDDGATLPEVVIDLLRRQNHSIAVAESCTGGRVMSQLVSVAGCSDVLLEGLCTYSNGAKVARLGVCAELIAAHGAVSAEVAVAMAQQVVKTSGATVGLSTTGIAGPGGGTADKPVGLVYVGLCVDGEAEAVQFNLIGNRDEVRIRATNLALDMVRQRLG